MKRTVPQNAKYQKLVAILHEQDKLLVWDGRFQTLGYPNPIPLSPRGFGYKSFRDLLKQLDWTYEKDNDGIAVSSTKLTVEDMGKHIMFLECLCAELIGE